MPLSNTRLNRPGRAIAQSATKDFTKLHKDNTIVKHNHLFNKPNHENTKYIRSYRKYTFSQNN